MGLEQLQRVGDDRLDARQRGLCVDVGEPDLPGGHALGAEQLRQYDREVDRDPLVLDGEGDAEVVRLEVGAVVDDALLADLGVGERASGDVRDQELFDHLDDRRARGGEEQDLAVADEADVLERVAAGAERRDVERRVGAHRQLETLGEGGAAERGGDDRVGGEGRQAVGRGGRLEERRDDRGDVFRDRLDRGLGLQADAEEEDLPAAEHAGSAGGRLRRGRGRRGGAQPQQEPGGEGGPSRHGCVTVTRTVAGRLVAPRASITTRANSSTSTSPGSTKGAMKAGVAEVASNSVT